MEAVLSSAGEPPGIGLTPPKLVLGPARAAKISNQALGDSPSTSRAWWELLGIWVGPPIVSREGSQKDTDWLARIPQEPQLPPLTLASKENWFLPGPGGSQATCLSQDCNTQPRSQRPWQT